MQNKAGINSQLGIEICDIQDTEEMYWLRESDDYQSKVKLGIMLSGQYRFKEAIMAFEQAAKIKSDDASLYTKLGGAYLTLFRFEKAKECYDKAIVLGISEKAVAYPYAIWHYLQKDYKAAAARLVKCLPCGGEMKIAAIYWEILATKKAGIKSELEKEYHSEMNVGHHTAYKLAVQVMLGEISFEDAMNELDDMDDLSFVVAAYGIAEYLGFQNMQEKKQQLIKRVLERESMWPCVSYLAAYKEV